MKGWFVFALVVVLAALGGCDEATGGQNLEWLNFESESGRFSVLFPGEPDEQVESVQTAIGVIESQFFMVTLENMAYSVNLADYPPEMIAAGDTQQMLDGARDGAVSNVNGELLDEKELTLSGYPGREFKVKVEDEGIVVRARIYLVNERLYVIQALSKERLASSEDIDKFLDSFQLKP
jgi:hypothetical protein